MSQIGHVTGETCGPVVARRRYAQFPPRCLVAPATPDAYFSSKIRCSVKNESLCAQLRELLTLPEHSAVLSAYEVSLK